MFQNSDSFYPSVIVEQNENPDIRRSPSQAEHGVRERRRSLVTSLENYEEKMFECVENGNLEVLQQLVNENKVNINSRNYQGLSVLHIALNNKDNVMIEYLLRSGLNVDRLKDCALFCIKANKMDRMNTILSAVKRLSSLAEESSPCVDSTDFPDYMTPLMLAAKCGHVEIVECLLHKRLHPKIHHPHRTGCVCEECLYAMKNEDPLKESMTKLERYRAICNPAYVCQTTDDPILMAFELVDELIHTASRNRMFLRHYEELIKVTSRFSADLVANCRGIREVEIVLNERNGTNAKVDLLFPRLILAVEYKQKHFVAENNVQEVLESAWVGNWYNWRAYSHTELALIILGRVFMLPFLCLVLVLFPNSSWASFYKVPINRLISSVAAYSIFLGLLFWESNRDKVNQTRYDIQYHIGQMLLIFPFAAAYVTSTLRTLLIVKSKRFFSYSWNIYDLLTSISFIIACLCWAWAIFTLSSLPNLERKYWHYLDPQLLYEGFFCIATVMSFGRLLTLVQIHSDLGPMQVSLLKMSKTFSQFLIIFAIVIGSFVAGMCTLYQYYEGMKRIDPRTKIETRQEPSFISVYSTVKFLFWGILCMSNQEAGTVVIENLPTKSGDLDGINTHDFTQAVGYLLFAIYTVLTVILLLNMLIAAMSHTYVRVTVDNVDTEWVFGRTEVYLEYMSRSALPPPFSILHHASEFVLWAYSKILKRSESEKEISGEEQFSTEESRDLMVKLVSRYFSQREKEKKVFHL